MKRRAKVQGTNHAKVEMQMALGNVLKRVITAEEGG